MGDQTTPLGTFGRPSLLARLVVGGAIIALATSPARGLDRLWATDQGNWNTPAAWNPAGVPADGDRNYVGNGLTANITGDVPQTMQFYIGGIRENGQQLGGPGVVNQTGGNLVLRNRAGTAGGDPLSNAWMVVGQAPDSNGTYNLSGGRIDLNTDFMTYGQDGTGTLNVSGTGSVDTRGLIFGRWVTGQGTGTIAGDASIIARDGGLTVAQQGHATVTQTGGNVNVVASNDGNAWMYIGRDGGTGTYNMSGGSLNSGTRIQVGQSRPSVGTLNVTGGDVTTGVNTTIGDSGTGTLNVSGGTYTANGEGLIIGGWRDTGAVANPGGNGTLTVSGSGVINAANLRIARGNPETTTEPNGGIFNTGLVQQTGGTINVAGDVSLGTGNTKSNATYSMGGGALHAKQIHVGQGGIGAFNTTGGTVTAAEAFMVSQVDGPRVGVGSGTQTGGVISADGWISIGTDAGTNGTYTLSGGSLNTLGDIPENRPGDFNVSDNAGSTGTLNLSGTGIAQGVTVYVGKNANTNGTVNQTGGTMRVGAGNLRIAVNDPTARGAYNLQGGVLDLQGHDIVIGPGTAAFTMTGGEIRNAGVVNLALNQQGGKLAPGDGAGNAGRSTLMAGYVLGAPGTLEIDVNGAAPGAGYDQLAVSGGGVSLAGSLATLVGFAPVLGEQFVILDNQGASAITGAFAGLPEGSVFSAGGARFQITYHGGDGNDVMLTAQAAPEPGAFAGGAIATAGLLLRRRCRRRA